MKKEEKKQVFVLCPKCELNYMNKKDKMCPVCKAESGLMDKSILLLEEEEVERLCPVCKMNPLSDDEEICFVCAKEKPKEEPEPEWIEPLEEEKPIDGDDMEISLDLVAEEEEAEESFDEEYTDPDDFDYDVDPDDYDDEDFDEDDEDFDEEI